MDVSEKSLYLVVFPHSHSDRPLPLAAFRHPSSIRTHAHADAAQSERTEGNDRCVAAVLILPYTDRASLGYRARVHCAPPHTHRAHPLHLCVASHPFILPVVSLVALVALPAPPLMPVTHTYHARCTRSASVPPLALMNINRSCRLSRQALPDVPCHPLPPCRIQCAAQARALTSPPADLSHVRAPPPPAYPSCGCATAATSRTGSRARLRLSRTHPLGAIFLPPPILNTLACTLTQHRV
ncbi:hypothetical protein EVG20_g6503 [Dentipellis fragilis]|uniref:Uncharacterized protein n=1 Tax=Dentipellis fragilis TaxID=205917 RepID=A0A4Y9YM00_9AGAM|nr:hypothetical protein EVG20_g6503 [Dentipellis fragilis]